MKEIKINLTDTQYKGLQYAALSPEKWAENAVTERARIANDEVVKIVVEHCLDNGIQIPATREEIVEYAFANNIVKTAEQRNLEAAAELQAEARVLINSLEG